MLLLDSKRKSYWWFDTPDGEDIIKKTDFALKLGYLAGLGPVIFDMTSNPQPTLKLHLFRATKIMVPFLGAAAMFTLTTQLLCRKFPELDRRLAYGIGGASVGTVVQAVAKNKQIGSMVAFYGFIFCPMLREFADSDISLLGKSFEFGADNDVELFRYSTRIDPGLNLPPPYARPARGGSTLYN